MRKLVLVLSLTLLASPVLAGEQSLAVPLTGGPLQLMTPEIFRGAGLAKLSPNELAALQNWIAGYAAVMSRYANAAGATQGVVETNIDGEFNGWDGDKVYKMRNGQIWQQSSYHYHYHYAYSPEVLIYPSGGGYKIHVKDDDDEDVSVWRLK